MLQPELSWAQRHLEANVWCGQMCSPAPVSSSLHMAECFAESLFWPLLLFLYLLHTCFPVLRVDNILRLKILRVKSPLSLNLLEIPWWCEAKPSEGCFPACSPGAQAGQAHSALAGQGLSFSQGAAPASQAALTCPEQLFFHHNQAKRLDGGWWLERFSLHSSAMRGNRAFFKFPGFKGNLVKCHGFVKTRWCVQGVNYSTFQKKLLWGKQKFLQGFSASNKFWM